MLAAAGEHRQDQAGLGEGGGGLQWCLCVCWGGEARAEGETQRSCWTRTEEPLSLYI